VKLEGLVFDPRPRSHWEALDLGVLLARRWYGTLLVAWLITAVPLLVVGCALFGPSSGWTLLLFWWFKPLYERLPLKWLSTAVFGTATPRRALPGQLGAALRRGLPGVLTLRRLSPYRAFVAPVHVLEGGASARRLSLLSQRAGSAATWATVLGVHLEAFLVGGLLLALWLLIPAQIDIDWWAQLAGGSLPEFSRWAGTVLNALTIFAAALVAPFYVAAGFALYLNRRIELEAWDIELGFRRLRQRLGVALLLLAAPGLALLADPVDAAVAQRAGEYLEADVEASLETLSEDRQASRRLIDEVLAGPDFNSERRVRYPAFLDDLFDDGEEAPRAVELPEWAITAFRWLARLIEVLLWVGVVALLVWVGLRIYRSGLGGGVGRRRVPELAVIAGQRVTADSLPADVVGSARQAWQRGDRRAAAALLYRAALAHLQRERQVPFRASDTEGDCLRRVGALDEPPLQDAFGQLTGFWQRGAYARRWPGDRDFAELLALWQQAFMPPGEEPGA